MFKRNLLVTPVTIVCWVVCSCSFLIDDPSYSALDGGNLDELVEGGDASNDAEMETDSETETATSTSTEEGDTDIDADIDVDTDTDTDVDNDSDTDTDSDTDVDTASDNDTGTDADVDADTDVDTDIDTDSDSGGDSDNDTDTDTDIDTDSDLDSDTDTDSDVDTDGDSDTDTDTDTCNDPENECCGVECNTPPASECRPWAGATPGELEEYAPLGECIPWTGKCVYSSTVRTCNPDLSCLNSIGEMVNICGRIELSIVEMCVEDRVCPASDQINAWDTCPVGTEEVFAFCLPDDTKCCQDITIT